MSDEVPKDAPRLTVGKKLCAIWEQSWLTPRGETKRAVALSEIEPAEYVTVEGRDVVASWRRKFKGVNLSLPDKAAWIRFTEDLNKAFGKPIQQPLANGTEKVPRANPPVRTLPSA